MKNSISVQIQRIYEGFIGSAEIGFNTERFLTFRNLVADRSAVFGFPLEEGPARNQGVTPEADPPSRGENSEEKAGKGMSARAFRCGPDSSGQIRERGLN
jgi:hypothetical protein